MLIQYNYYIDDLYLYALINKSQTGVKVFKRKDVYEVEKIVDES